MKLKYVGTVSPIPLYKIGESVQTGEIVDLKPDYASELMAQFPGKFVEPGSADDPAEKAKKKPGRPSKEETEAKAKAKAEADAKAKAPDKNKMADPKATK